MSTRDDATLTEAEKAAFARIQAQAIAHDPGFGSSRAGRTLDRLRSGFRGAGGWARRPWAGPVAMILGVAAVVVGLMTTLAVAVVGLVLIVAGAVPVVEAVRARIERSTTDTPS